MLKLKLLGKEEPVYKMNEKFPFSLSVRAEKDIPNLCLRLEIRAADGMSVGASILHDFATLKKGEEKKFQFQADFGTLIPGKYIGLLVLYEVNEWGTYDDLDAVFPAFVFEVRDIEDGLNIHWNSNAWGKIKFADLVLEENN